MSTCVLWFQILRILLTYSLGHTKSGLTTPFLGGGKASVSVSVRLSAHAEVRTADGSKASGRRNKRLKLKRGWLRRIWYETPLRKLPSRLSIREICKVLFKSLNRGWHPSPRQDIMWLVDAPWWSRESPKWLSFFCLGSSQLKAQV